MKIIPFFFLVSLFIGIWTVYAFYPMPKVIIKQPNPNNCKKNLFVDDNGVCYRYSKKEIDCPADNYVIKY